MELKTCTCCGETKETSEFSKDRQLKSGIRSKCKICCRMLSKKWRENNVEHVKSYAKKHAADYNKLDYVIERGKFYSRKYRKNNPEASLKATNGWKKRNLERFQEIQKEYRKNNRGKCAANLANRRARLKSATVIWSNREAMTLIYVKCRRLSTWLQEEFHVDHIVPLRSELVCGLHCEANLQILPQLENLSKSNSFWPDMW